VSLSNYERETVISMNNEEDVAYVTSSQGPIWTRMRKLGIQPDREEKMDGVVVTKFYTVPKKWIKITPPSKREPSRLTEEQRKAAAERLAAVRKKKTERSG